MENIDGSNFSLGTPAANIGLRPGIDLPVIKNEPATKGRVLVVDDEPTILLLASELLSSSGLMVETASNGLEAIEKVSKSPFDVVVTDYRMPGGISGGDLHNWIVKNITSDPPNIVFMTGDGMNEETDRFFQANECVVMFKPFEAMEFVKVIKNAWRYSSRTLARGQVSNAG
ncbi:MAG TPA: response regulator [Blastocatellia bacterium]|nr:response regulator [Blastocatellia bacterium]